MPSNLQPIAWFPNRGLDLTSAPHKVPLNMAQDGFDWYIEDGENLKKRPGYDDVNVSAVSASPTINGLYSLYLSDGTKYELVGTSNGDIWQDSSGTITTKRIAGLATTYPLDYTQFLDTGIWADGGFYLKTWNGSASGTISAGGSAIACEMHLNKLFTFDINSSTVRYSQTGSISAFTGSGTDTFNFNQNDGQVGTALHSFARNELLIFKERSMGKLLGYDKPSFNLLTIDSTIGCVNKRTIKSFRSNTSGGLCMWAFKDGIYAYDGTTPKKISEAIQSFWNTINPDYFDIMDATIDTDKGLYLLTVAAGTSQTTPNRLIVIDLMNPWQDEKGFHFPIFIWRLSAYSLNQEVQMDGSYRLVFGGTSGVKYNFDDDTLSDNGSSITSYVVSPSMIFDTLGNDNCLRRAYIAMESASGTFDVYGEIKDGEDWQLQDSIDMSGGADRLGIDFALGISPLGFTEANFSTRVNMSLRSRRIKVKLEQATDSYGFTLNSPVEFYQKSGGMRG